MNKTLRIVFMGTPDFAVASLKAIHEAGILIAGVITAPDKPAGRGKKIQSPAVKQFAIENNIVPVLQPQNLKDPTFTEKLKKLNGDIFIVVAFRMLPEVVWSMPVYGTVNLHASLLPHYRGAAPINRVIMNGENKTGVTTFFIEKDIDTGKIILQESIDIEPDEDAGSLHDKLMLLGAELLVKTIHSIANGVYEATPQNILASEEQIKYAPKIFKEDCRINWNKPVRQVYNFIRGLSPYPAAWTEFSNNSEKTTFKIYEASAECAKHNNRPGMILIEENSLKISCTDGFIKVKSLQSSGKKRMATDDFLRGLTNKEKFVSAS